ncbi:H-NS family nucleoid-associated regulatory protein [Ramlibacter rhizophilus]|uniref:H-NS histone family protein n=1 Tax=Ramlibacter rhizophilus TaxID=1781167 RepID=A0A4Z0BKQ4_9BURK|nr:H-NS histone family protein [Ramlibacter rhizophilus]TFY99896.1 H-NS histone family protein [Ramlibacter rhizophilus]
MPRKTYAEIQDEIVRLQREAEEAREAELAEVIEKINKAIEVYGLRASDLNFPASNGVAPRGRRAAAAPRAGKRGGRKGAAAKYRDAQGNVWGGRGPRPQWLRDALASGKTLEDFLA